MPCTCKYTTRPFHVDPACVEGRTLSLKVAAATNTFNGNTKGRTPDDIDDLYVARQKAEQAFIAHCTHGEMEHPAVGALPVIHLLARIENVRGTTIESAIKAHDGRINAVGSSEHCVVSLTDVFVEQLADEVTRRRLSGNEGHLRWLHASPMRTCYRITLRDGQRLIYVSFADCYLSFLAHDSHVSFGDGDGDGEKR